MPHRHCGRSCVSVHACESFRCVQSLGVGSTCRWRSSHFCHWKVDRASTALPFVVAQPLMLMHGRFIVDIGNTLTSSLSNKVGHSPFKPFLKLGYLSVTFVTYNIFWFSFCLGVCRYDQIGDLGKMSHVQYRTKRWHWFHVRGQLALASLDRGRPFYWYLSGNHWWCLCISLRLDKLLFYTWIYCWILSNASRLTVSTR